MKKMSELMQEIGFNPNGSTSVKEAFIKHLIKASVGVSVPTPSERKEIFENPERIKVLPVPQQLTFAFVEETRPKPRKKSAS